MMNNDGVITQLIGAVVDVKFETEFPEIYTALEATMVEINLFLKLPNIWAKIV